MYIKPDGYWAGHEYSLLMRASKVKTAAIPGSLFIYLHVRFPTRKAKTVHKWPIDLPPSSKNIHVHVCV